MTDITPRDITKALRTYIPHATLRTKAGDSQGAFEVRMPAAAFDHIGGAHGVSAALGSQLGQGFGVNGVSWSTRGDKAATVYLYTRAARDAATAAAERAERDRQRELARPKATIAEALAALDNRPSSGPGTGITENITLNEKLALGALVDTARLTLVSLTDALAAIESARYPGSYDAACRQLNNITDAVRTYLGTTESAADQDTPEDEDEDPEDLGYIACESGDGERSYACTGDGVRVCDDHALEAARRGESLEWDDDCSQLVEAECKGLAWLANEASGQHAALKAAERQRAWHEAGEPSHPFARWAVDTLELMPCRSCCKTRDAETHTS